MESTFFPPPMVALSRKFRAWAWLNLALALAFQQHLATGKSISHQSSADDASIQLRYLKSHAERRKDREFSSLAITGATPPCPDALKSIVALNSAAASVNNPQTRDAWIARFAKSVPGASRVLDVSAGARPYKHLWSHCKYFSHEFAGNQEIIDSFRGEGTVKSLTELRKTHDFLGQVHATTAPSGSFDVVMLTEVLEHVPEPLLAIKELARVAKKGGHIMVTAPFTSGSHQQPFHFSSGYSREFYRHAAKLYGLRVVEIASQGDFFKLMAQDIHFALTCGGLVPGADNSDVDRLATITSTYLLQLSALVGDNSDKKTACADQFTIGWMVHYVKE